MRIKRKHIFSRVGLLAPPKPPDPEVVYQLQIGIYIKYFNSFLQMIFNIYDYA